MASGSASVKKPPPWIGGSWAGSPSTSSGTPNDRRSRPEFGIDHRAFVDDDELGRAEAGASSHSSKLGVSSPLSRVR